MIKVLILKYILLTVDNCTYYINLIKVLSVTPWGSDRIFEACKVSRLQYGSQAFCCASSNQLKRLDVIYNKALRIITQVAICTPTESVLAELGKLPLTLRGIKQGIKYIYKCKHLTPSNPVNTLEKEESIDINDLGNSTISYFYKFINDFGVAQLPISVEAGSQTKSPWQSQTPKVSFRLRDEISNVESLPLKNAIFRAATNDIYSEYVHIYTDGSKDPVSGKTGIAFYIEPSLNTKAIIYRARLSNNFSVYTSEHMAITQALKWIMNTTLTEGEYAEKYVIISDSLSALQAIGGSKSVRPELVHRIYSICNNLVKRSVTVVFEWVPSHIGITGNEIADINAKKYLK